MSSMHGATMKIYWYIIWPVVLYLHGTGSVTFKEEHMLRMFENRMLRKIFGPKMDELRGKW
jgi:hypothetical protein